MADGTDGVKSITEAVLALSLNTLKREIERDLKKEYVLIPWNTLYVAAAIIGFGTLGGTYLAAKTAIETGAAKIATKDIKALKVEATKSNSAISDMLNKVQKGEEIKVKDVVITGSLSFRDSESEEKATITLQEDELLLDGRFSVKESIRIGEDSIVLESNSKNGSSIELKGDEGTSLRLIANRKIAMATCNSDTQLVVIEASNKERTIKENERKKTGTGTRIDIYSIENDMDVQMKGKSFKLNQ